MYFYRSTVIAGSSILSPHEIEEPTDALGNPMELVSVGDSAISDHAIFTDENDRIAKASVEKVLADKAAADTAARTKAANELVAIGLSAESIYAVTGIHIEN